MLSIRRSFADVLVLRLAQEYYPSIRDSGHLEVLTYKKLLPLFRDGAAKRVTSDEVFLCAAPKRP